MIYDTLNNLPNYLGMSENLDTVIEYVMARDINTLPTGKTRIDGDKAVVTVSTVTPQVSEKAPFVRHDAHLTLETDLEGLKFRWASSPPTSPPTRPRTSPWAAPAPALPECSARAALPSIWPGSPINPASRHRAAAS